MTYIITKIKNTLCDDIKKLFGTIYVITKSSLSKQSYLKNYVLKNASIESVHYQNYIRDIIRKDCFFIIKMNLELHFNKWLKKKYLLQRL